MAVVSSLPHIWSKDALHCKAQRYIDLMLSVEKSDWRFGLWSSLALEMIAKAAISNISPVLLADGKDWNNLYFSLGHNPTSKKFAPKSTDISEILRRLEILLPDFTPEMNNFCILHMNRRNGELHSGDLPFDNLGTSQWLPLYYLSIEKLLESYNETLENILNQDEANVAKTLIKSFQDDAAKSVNQTIKAHKTVWENKTEEEQKLLRQQAETNSIKQKGHRVDCPACCCQALLHGSSIGKPTSKIEEYLIVEKQDMLPSSFECIACNLRISGHSKLNACGLGDTFVETNRYEASEYFEIESDTDDIYFDYEPDFNEK